MTDHCDLLVAGAGIAGLALAAAVADRGWRVRVVSRDPLPAFPAPSEPLRPRVSTINTGALRALERLGVLSALSPQRTGPLHRLTVWHRDGEIRYDSAAAGEPRLGMVLENDALIAALALRCAAAPNVTVETGVELVAAEPGPRTTRVTLRDGRAFSARLLIGADGGRSTVRDLCGIPARRHDYAQRAVVANVEVARPHRQTALQRFMPAGPLALLPLPNRHCALVWSTTPDHAQRLCSLDPKGFATLLERETESRLGAVTSVGVRASFALHRVTAAGYIARRAALVGDAAHVVHPLAGLGANLALADAFALAELLGEPTSDPGGRRLLRRYERWRRSENAPVDGTIHGLDRLFRADHPLLRAAGGRGLAVANRLAPLKRALIERACGLAGDQPRLMREPL